MRPRFRRSRAAFLIGCGVGNRLNLLPLPNRETDDLDAFLGLLSGFVPGGGRHGNNIRAAAREFREATAAFLAGAEPEGFDRQAVVAGFLNEMASVADLVRVQCTEDERAWFNLGRLLFELGSRCLHYGPAAEENHPSNRRMATAVPTMASACSSMAR